MSKFIKSADGKKFKIKPPPKIGTIPDKLLVVMFVMILILSIINLIDAVWVEILRCE